MSHLFTYTEREYDSKQDHKFMECFFDKVKNVKKKGISIVSFYYYYKYYVRRAYDNCYKL